MDHPVKNGDPLVEEYRRTAATAEGYLVSTFERTRASVYLREEVKRIRDENLTGNDRNDLAVRTVTVQILEAIVGILDGRHVEETKGIKD